MALVNDIENPTVTTSIPVTECGALIFEASGVNMTKACLRVGKRTISYVFTPKNAGERVKLDFLGGAPFQATLVIGRQQVFVDITHEVSGAFPSLHMGCVMRGGQSVEKKWSSDVASHSDRVTVCDQDGVTKSAALVYYRGDCGLVFD